MTFLAVAFEALVVYRVCRNMSLQIIATAKSHHEQPYKIPLPHAFKSSSQKLVSASSNEFGLDEAVPAALNVSETKIQTKTGKLRVHSKNKLHSKKTTKRLSNESCGGLSQKPSKHSNSQKQSSFSKTGKQATTVVSKTHLKSAKKSSHVAVVSQRSSSFNSVSGEANSNEEIETDVSSESVPEIWPAGIDWSRVTHRPGCCLRINRVHNK